MTILVKTETTAKAVIVKKQACLKSHPPIRKPAESP